MKINYFTKKIKTLIFFISLTIVLIVGFVLFQFQVDKLEKEFQFNSKNIIHKDINKKISNIETILSLLNKVNQSNSKLNSSSFTILTEDFLTKHSYINSIMYSNTVLDKSKMDFITYMKDIGYYNFNINSYDNLNKKFTSSTILKKYSPIVLIAPYSYEYTQYMGYDIFNNSLLKNSFQEAIISARTINKSSKLFNNTNNLFFIKAVYFGETVPSRKKERMDNLKGFYIINTDVNKMSEEYKELYTDYNVQILFSSKITSNLNKSKKDDLNTIKKISYLAPLNQSLNEYVYITKDIRIKDINISIILFVMVMLMVVHLLVIFIVEKNKVARKELSYQATHDDLTGLTNRNYFKSMIEEVIENHYLEANNVTAILFIDLDKFKDINDTLGHKFGDEVLIEVSKRFKSVMRNNDTICRHGGDEFLIMIQDMNNMEGIISILRKIMDTISEPINFNQQKINITISMGISLFPNDGKTVDDLLKNADSAMYKAKDEGRNTFRFYTEDMTLEIMQKVELENKLKEAIKDDDFLVFFQPQYNAKTNQIIGMEALVRWLDKNNTLISPMEFIPMANETGMIVELDRLVMNKALKQFSIWKQKNLNPGSLSLNLSMKHLKSDDFIEYLKHAIITNNCSLNDIELEIIEDEIMEDPLGSIAKLKKIQSCGVKISIDDFGTGHSSLSYLKNLPIDKLKIDRAFIKDLPDDTFDIAISKTIMELAKNLKLEVIAEGVETLEQKNFLLENGCENIQGFFYSKPISKNEMEILLKKSKL